MEWTLQRLTIAIDHEAIARAIRANKDTLLTNLRDDVRDCLQQLSPSDALTLRLLHNGIQLRTLAPSVSKEYGGALISFCRGKTFNGNKWTAR